jgi:RHS repeat-associated protein
VGLKDEGWGEFSGEPDYKVPMSSSGIPNTPTPKCDCCCDCSEGAGGKNEYEAGGLLNQPQGLAHQSTAELTQSGGGAGNMHLGEGLQYSGDGSGAGGGAYGNSWVNAHQPRLIKDGDNVLMESGQRETVTFIKVGSGYVAEYFVRDVLTRDAVTGQYTVTSPDGEQKVFSGSGQLLAKRDAYGNQASYSYMAGELKSVEVGSGTTAAGYYYSFDTLGRLESVVMRVGGTTGSFDYRRITYQYTTGGDLKLVEVAEKVNGVWEGVSVQYYRYDEEGRLSLVFNDHGVHLLAGNVTDWLNAPDAQVAPYASAQYGYQGDGRVSWVKVNGGQYMYRVTYARSMHSGSTMNVWTTKSVVTRPDGSVWTYYYNRALSLLLVKVVEKQPDGMFKVWYPVCQQFDPNARVILDAPSSAVESVDEASPTLFTLKANSGPIQVISYDSSGNRTMEGIKKGSTGSVVKQREMTYEPRTVSGLTIYLKKTETVYRDATETSASNPVTTTLAYAWYKKGTKDTFQIRTITTTLPAVPDTENGDGRTGTVVDVFDRNGFLIKHIDALGARTRYVYDAATGGLLQMIEDVGTGRLNLTTDYELDPLGRTVLELGPVHEIALSGAAVNVRRARWTQYLDWRDEVRTIQGYVEEADGSEHTMNPVRISKEFVLNQPQGAGWRTEEISAVYTGSGVPAADHDFAQSDYVRWSMTFLDRTQRELNSRLYHVIPATGLGSSGTNYAVTQYGYDSAGRRHQVTSPEGTINRTVYNAMNWPLRERVGTSGSNLVTTRFKEYDLGLAGGDGNLTKVTSRVDEDSGNDRIVVLRYDWRNRPLETEANDGTRTVIRRTAYDNRSNKVRLDEYQTAVLSGNLINRAEAFFDGRNRRYRTKRYGVTVGTGAVGTALISETYFDQDGRAVRNQPAGRSGYTVTHLDAVGRARKQFRAYGGTLDYLNPRKISDALVMEQTEMAYDAAGNTLSSILRQRFDNATGAGQLKSPGAEPKARVSYLANYPDALGRTIATVNYGTNGAAAWSRPATPASASDTVLVSTFAYNAAGDQVESVDPMGTVNQQEFDQAGRQVKTIENYVSGSTGPDKNKTTRFEYNLDGNLRKLIAENSVTGNQTTEWVYGVTPALGSQLSSNGLVYQKIYPDSTGSADRVTYRYNRLGQAIRMVDQAGTTHRFGFDRFGRPITDTVSAFGTNIDQTVRKVARSYEVRGMLEKVTSFGASDAVLNEVQLAYNAFSQVEKDYQAHSGAVNTGSTLHVTYSYANGSTNTVRRTGITYPDGATTITTAYDGAAADALSRPDALKEGTATLCSYRYLGSGMVIGVKYDAASDVELTYENGSTGDAGDPYTGLDRFGRLVETIWKNSGGTKVQSRYGRNRFGGVTWRRDDEAHNQSVATEDHFYWYDGLYQVKEHQRGDLTGTFPNYTGITNLQQDEDWTYDPTGNWDAYSRTNPAQSQTRTHNEANEIELITASVGNVAPTYDPVGNMTTLPKDPGGSTAQYDLKWDAWNRLVQVKDGTTTVASYAYDGLFRRTKKINPGSSETRHYYYNDQWRALEERVEGATAAVDRQYTWGLRDRWDLLRRKRSTGSSSLNEVHFCLRDYLDPVAIVGTDGIVKERYAYDAFGNVRFLAPDYSTRSSSSFAWEFLFHAEFRDADSELYNYGFRYYNTALGRWLSRDPVEEVGGSNLCLAFNNNPELALDLYGTQIPGSDSLPDVPDYLSVVSRGAASLLDGIPGFNLSLRHFSDQRIDLIQIIDSRSTKWYCDGTSKKDSLQIVDIFRKFNNIVPGARGIPDDWIEKKKPGEPNPCMMMLHEKSSLYSTPGGRLREALRNLPLAGDKDEFFWYSLVTPEGGDAADIVSKFRQNNRLRLQSQFEMIYFWTCGCAPGDKPYECISFFGDIVVDQNIEAQRCPPIIDIMVRTGSNL